MGKESAALIIVVIAAVIFILMSIKDKKRGGKQAAALDAFKRFANNAGFRQIDSYADILRPVTAILKNYSYAVYVKEAFQSISNEQTLICRVQFASRGSPGHYQVIAVTASQEPQADFALLHAAHVEGVLRKALETSLNLAYLDHLKPIPLTQPGLNKDFTLYCPGDVIPDDTLARDLPRRLAAKANFFLIHEAGLFIVRELSLTHTDSCVDNAKDLLAIIHELS